MNVIIVNQQKKYRIPKKFMNELVNLINKILIQKKVKLKNKKQKLEKISLKTFKKEIVLVFVSAKEIKFLNSRFRKKDKPTDILSFQSLDQESFGELILCPEIIFNQARENSWPQKYEYAYMILHGFLHLFGYDHESKFDAEEMFDLQDHLFESIKIQI